MINQDLNQMVTALVDGDNDKAKEHLSQYFNSVASKSINEPATPAQQPPSPVNEAAYDVYLNKKLIDTVFFNGYSAEEVKKSLIDHDGYDSGIVVKVSRR